MKRSKTDMMIRATMVATMVGGVLAGASPASAATCSYASTTFHMSVSARVEEVRIDRTASGNLRLNGATCGSATVTNTDTVAISAGGIIRIDMTNGSMAPGRAAETDTPEIEFTISGGASGGRQFEIIGGSGTDRLGISDTGATTNGDDDLDVTWTLVNAPNSVILSGAGGADVLDAHQAAGKPPTTRPVTLRGGDGDDNLHGGSSPTISGNQLVGGDGDDVVQAGTGPAIIKGEAGSDELVGGPANDQLDGGLGGDAISGGSGIDTLSYQGRAHAIVATIGGSGGSDLDGDGVPDEGDTIDTSIENLTGGSMKNTLTGSAGPNHLTNGFRHAAATATTTLLGLGGDDVLQVFAAGGVGGTADGGEGDDSLYLEGSDSVGEGGPGNDDLLIFSAFGTGRGGPGDDEVSSGTLTSTLDGGDGQDIIIGQGGRQILIGGAGNDDLQGAGGNDLLDGGPGLDRIDGGDGTTDRVTYADRTASVSIDLTTGLAGETGEGDLLSDIEEAVGGAGNDVLRGRSGHNRLEGGAGDDAFRPSGPQDDEYLGGEGTDTVNYTGMSEGVVADLRDPPDAGILAHGGDADAFGSVEKVIGTDVADTMIAGGAAVRFEGRGGDDILRGGDGPDELLGADGDDAISPGGGDGDLMFGGSGTDLVSYDGIAGDLVLSIGGGLDGEDTDGDGSADETDDINVDVENLVGGNGDDVLTGDADDNHLDGGPGADQMIGADGTDRVTYEGRSTEVVAAIGGSAEGEDTDGDGLADEGDRIDATVEDLTGGTGDDALTGNVADNVIDGNLGDDHLIGGLGDDRLVSTSGADHLDGGAGTDTGDFQHRSAPLILTIGGGADGPDDGTGLSSEDGDIGSDVENLIGGGVGDLIVGDDADNVLVSGPGSQLGVDRIFGNGGNDELRSTQGSADVILSGTTLSGGEGDDLLVGGAWPDLLIGGPGDDTHRGGGSIDWASYEDRDAPVNVTMDGDANDGEPGEADAIENDVEAVRGGSADDTMTGGPRADRLAGGPGEDLLTGGEGDDVFVADVDPDGADTIRGGHGSDTVSYAAREAGVMVTLDGRRNDGGAGDELTAGELDLIAGDVENATGGAGDDVLTGNAARNTLTGGSGDDLIRPGRGNDAVAGGPGIDTATYSEASSRFFFSPTTASGPTTGESDSLSDLEALIGGAGADRFTGGTVLTTARGGPGNDQFIVSTASPLTDIDGGPGQDVISYEDLPSHDFQVDLARGDAIASTIGRQTLSGVENVSWSFVAGATVQPQVRGDAGPNRFEGSAMSDLIWGGGGNDVIAGLDGDDRIWGGSGDDRLSGVNGNDRISAGAGDDIVRGGGGNDLLDGGIDEDYIGADHGDDRVFARDGDPDEIDGSSGTDRHRSDDIDDASAFESTY